jgi:uncharacterized protein YpuA (DUF1002 family)
MELSELTLSLSNKLMDKIKNNSSLDEFNKELLKRKKEKLNSENVEEYLKILNGEKSKNSKNLSCEDNRELLDKLKN